MKVLDNLALLLQRNQGGSAADAARIKQEQDQVSCCSTWRVVSVCVLPAAWPCIFSLWASEVAEVHLQNCQAKKP